MALIRISFINVRLAVCISTLQGVFLHGEVKAPNTHSHTCSELLFIVYCTTAGWIPTSHCAAHIIGQALEAQCHVWLKKITDIKSGAVNLRPLRKTQSNKRYQLYLLWNKVELYSICTSSGSIVQSGHQLHGFMATLVINPLL